MRVPFKFRPTLFNTLFVAAEASLGSDVGSQSPAPDSVIAGQAESSTVSETSVASPQTEGEQVAASVSGTDGQGAEQDIFEGIPSLEELQQQVEQKVPLSEGLLRLRTELERVKPLEKQFEPWKPIVEANDPVRIQERLTGYDSIFSPKLVNGQPVLDERNLPQTTAQPFLESMEAKRPGFAMDHFIDIMEYQVANPATGQREPLIGQFFREVLGLDANRLEQYQNIDTLIAKSNGNITPEELNLIPETEREAYKTLPAVIRKDWEAMEAEEQRYHLDNAKERLESRQFRQEQQQAQEQADRQHRQQFEAQVQADFTQDLATVRETAFTSLRDNLAKVWQPSTDEVSNRRYYNDVLSPLKRLIDPDLQADALQELQDDGIKINVAEFNEQMAALVGARQTYVRATAFNDGVAADRALQDYNRLQTQMMAKFHTIAMSRAEKYGYQAKAIAEKKGELLTTASQVRPVVPGSGQVGQGETYIDPRSREAIMRDYQASRTG